jgi:hypothetical protein
MSSAPLHAVQVAADPAGAGQSNFMNRLVEEMGIELGPTCR